MMALVMPDLGKYADAVLGSYAVSLVLLAGIIGFSIAQARRARRRLVEAEARATAKKT